MKKKKIQQKVAQRAPIVKRKQQAPKLAGMDMNEVLDRGLEIVNRSEEEKDPEVSKAQRVYMRLTQDIPHDLRIELTARDAKFHDLVVQRDLAEKQGLFYRKADLERKASRRMEEILFEFADKTVPELIATGKILKYLDEEDKPKFTAMHGMLEIGIEVLDSVLVDVRALIDEYHFDTYVKLGSIGKAREDFANYVAAGITIPKEEHIIEMRNEEADRIYEFMKKRYAQLTKNIQRWDEKRKKKEPHPALPKGEGK